MTVHVDHVHHPKIIGRGGKVIQKIRDEHDVNIQFPALSPDDADAGEIDTITLTGYEHNCEAAKAAIEKIVKELASVKI